MKSLLKKVLCCGGEDESKYNPLEIKCAGNKDGIFPLFFGTKERDGFISKKALLTKIKEEKQNAIPEKESEELEEHRNNYEKSGYFYPFTKENYSAFSDDDSDRSNADSNSDFDCSDDEAVKNFIEELERQKKEAIKPLYNVSNMSKYTKKGSKNIIGTFQELLRLSKDPINNGTMVENFKKQVEPVACVWNVKAVDFHNQQDNQKDDLYGNSDSDSNSADYLRRRRQWVVAEQRRIQDEKKQGLGLFRY